MRRRLTLALLLGLLVLPAVASAQIIGIGDALNISTTSAQITNSNTNTAIFGGTIPAGFLSSGRVHLRIMGILSTAGSSPGTFTVQSILGPTTTTIVSAVTLDNGLGNAPASLDIWFSALGTTSQEHIFGVWSHQSTSTAFKQISAQAVGTADTTQNLGLTVNFQFNSAAVGNGWTTQSAIMTAGN